MYTKYEVSTSNPVPVELCTDNANDDDANNGNDNGQFLIVQGSLADKPNEPKKPELEYSRLHSKYEANVALLLIC